MPKPKLAVFKFASCDGCQLSLLDAEDELLAVAERRRDRLLPRSPHPGDRRPLRHRPGRGLDHDAPRRRADPPIRRQCRYPRDHRRLRHLGRHPGAAELGERAASSSGRVYATPEYIKTLATSTPIADHVLVDFELRGCPINKLQLVELISALLIGRRPRVPRHSVCIECKRRRTVCVAVAQGIACLGPVTQAGCEAICPSVRPRVLRLLRPEGTAEPGQPRPASTATTGPTPRNLSQLLRNFNGYAPEFREASNAMERGDLSAGTAG